MIFQCTFFPIRVWCFQYGVVLHLADVNGGLGGCPTNAYTISSCVVNSERESMGNRQWEGVDGQSTVGGS